MHMIARLPLSILAACSIAACTSVVDVKPERTAGLVQIDTWKRNAMILAKESSPNCKNKYANAQNSVNSWLDNQKLRADAVGSSINIFSTVDLSTNTISPQVTKAVADFENCTSQKWSLFGKNKVNTVEWSNTTQASAEILKWLYDAVMEERAKSVTKLEEKLDKLKWDNWEDVRK